MSYVHYMKHFWWKMTLDERQASEEGDQPWKKKLWLMIILDEKQPSKEDTFKAAQTMIEDFLL